MTTLALQPDASAGKDTHIAEANPTISYGGAGYFYTGGAAGSRNKALLEFDLSSIPSSATVNSATLELCGGATYSTVKAYRIRRAWVEAEATWNKYSSAGNWATGGCENTTSDRESTVLGTLVLNDGSLTTKSFALDATLVGEWVSGAFTNNGMHLADQSDANPWFRSSDYTTDTSQRPKLTVEYTVGGSTYPTFLFRQHSNLDALGGY